MHAADSVVAVFADHEAAGAAVRSLTMDGFATGSLSVLGKAYDRNDKAAGFYSAGGQVRFWGERGAFWSGLWNLFSGGLFVTVPVVGPVIALGYLATTAMSDVGHPNAIGVALSDIGIPDESAIQYEFAVKADGFLVMALGIGADVNRARSALAEAGPARIDTHPGIPPLESIAYLASLGI